MQLDLMFILFVLIGACAGFFVGALPGLSVTMAAALLLSLTYSWNPSHAIGLMMGVYVVGVYSGALPAILLNIPGAPSSVATTLDGYPMAASGQSRRAVILAAVYSFIGCLIGFAVLALLAGPLAAVATRFSSMDYLLLALFGLITICLISSGNFLKAAASALAGLAVSFVGLDSVSGTPRFTFGATALTGGIPTIPVLIGLFGLAEVLALAGRTGAEETLRPVDGGRIPPREILRHIPLALVSGLIGTGIGIMPGTGGPVASLLAYQHARRRVKKPAVPFGEGAPEGIVAAETANNACIGGALVPLLTLAVPGDAVTAVLLAALTLHGLRPGPALLSRNPEALWVFVVGGVVGSVALLLIGLLVAPRLTKILSIPRSALVPVVLLLCFVGSYAGNRSLFDVWVMLLFGILGLYMRKFNYPTAPLVLGLVLGPMLDSNLRRTLRLAEADGFSAASLFGRPITLVLCALLLVPVLYRVIAFFAARKRRAE